MAAVPARDSERESALPGAAFGIHSFGALAQLLSSPGLSSENRSAMARGVMPGSESVPIMVCVLPDPVCPNAKIVMEWPSAQEWIQGLTHCTVTTRAVRSCQDVSCLSRAAVREDAEGLQIKNKNRNAANSAMSSIEFVLFSVARSSARPKCIQYACILACRRVCLLRPRHDASALRMCLFKDSLREHDAPAVRNPNRMCLCKDSFERLVHCTAGWLSWLN